MSSVLGTALNPEIGTTAGKILTGSLIGAGEVMAGYVVDANIKMGNELFGNITIQQDKPPVVDAEGR